MSKKKGFDFWFKVFMSGYALNKASKIQISNNSELFENYKYTNPFTMPRLYHPFWGNTFNYNKRKKLQLEEAEAMADKINEVIYNTEGIELVPVSVSQGSSCIRIKFIPEDNIKKAFNLKRQIKFATENEETRIYPEGNKIVVEIPHKGSTVLFGDFMHDNRFIMETSKTVVPIGQDQNGEVVYGDIAKMPHMLVAGTTGSGKSVFLNGVITSLLMTNSPNDIRLVLVDPKMVEFKRFEHLKYVKYVYETKDAVDAFSKLCGEMDKRYALLSQKGCRDIDEYNEKFNGTLPKIVLVVDELADMMMNKQYKKQVETNIIRIAQKARACGIHMILATQRPQKEVVTGLIKANIPTRVCLSVMSRMDSMVVLDQVGAENLQGHGDMLYLDGMNNKEAKRLQGGYLTSQEIDNVVIPLIKENEPDVWNKMIKFDEIPQSLLKELNEFYEQEDLMYNRRSVQYNS